MKIYKKVRSTRQSIPYIEVNKDTVYIRFNIQEIDEEDFKGWEYDEIQYDLKEYLESLANNQDIQSMAMLISLLMAEIDTLRSRIEVLEGGVQ